MSLGNHHSIVAFSCLVLFSHLPGFLPYALSGNPSNDIGGGWWAAHWTYDPGRECLDIGKNVLVKMCRALVLYLSLVDYLFEFTSSL